MKSASGLNIFFYKYKMEYKESKLYPSLKEATAPEEEVHIVQGSAHTYRLQKISEIQKEIGLERDKRRLVKKVSQRSQSYCRS
jgi:hypothetical protein